MTGTSAWAGEFNPDWTVAPAATLEDWLGEHGLSVHLAAAACTDSQLAVLVMEDVLARNPLTQEHAAILARVTAIPERAWLNLEENYRDGLARGRKETDRD